MFVDSPEMSFLQDSSKPSLKMLSYLLRHKELWPKGFEWDFNTHYGCAIGLFHKMWGWDVEFIELSRKHGVVVETTYSRGSYAPVDDGNVTPLMVADRIDFYLNGE